MFFFFFFSFCAARKSLSPVLDGSSLVMKRRSPDEMEKDLRGADFASELSLHPKEGTVWEVQTLSGRWPYVVVLKSIFITFLFFLLLRAAIKKNSKCVFQPHNPEMEGCPKTKIWRILKQLRGVQYFLFSVNLTPFKRFIPQTVPVEVKRWLKLL